MSVLDTSIEFVPNRYSQYSDCTRRNRERDGERETEEREGMGGEKEKHSKVEKRKINRVQPAFCMHICRDWL